MLQIYPFYGDDVQDIYRKLNCFLQELAIIGVIVDPEHVRSNTKYYPDWDRTATTIEVCVFSDSLSPQNPASQIRDLHQTVVNGKPETEPMGTGSELIAQARALLEEHKSPAVLEYLADEGWRLRTDQTPDFSIEFWGVSDHEIVERVKRYLGIKEEKPADDFDPFLDSDDLS